MTVQEKMELLEEIMDVDEGTLTTEMLLEDIEEWDSLSKLSLMATMKKEFQKKITTDEIRNLKTVQDVLDCFE